MLKRGLSLAAVVVLASSLTMVSFGDSIKKTLSDDEIADSIKVEQPTSKMIMVENLPISGTITAQGVPVVMTLIKMEGKLAIDSAQTLQWPKVPSSYITKTFDSDKEKEVVSRFEKAYAERVKAGIDFENTKADYEKGKKDKVSSAKLKDLKEDLDKAENRLNTSIDNYKNAANDFSYIMQTVIFSEVSIGGKLPGFSKTVKAIDPGYYKLIFKRTDNDHVIKIQEFEVQMADDLKTMLVPVVPSK